MNISDFCNPIMNHKSIEVIDYMNDSKYIFDKNSKKNKDTILIKENIYDDDTLNIISNKISVYCTKYKTDGSYIYMWYFDKTKKSLMFEYDKDIDIPTLDVDYEFVYRSGNNVEKYKSMKNNTNFLFENINIDRIYFIHLYDFYKLHGININTKYSSSNWPSDLPNINLFKNGIIRKYWPFADNILNKNDYDISKLENIIDNTSKIIDIINDNDDRNSTCDDFKFLFIKLNILHNLSNRVNIIKIFAEIYLDYDIPFAKLVLDKYDESYYKIYKPAIYSDKNIINKRLLNTWIKDFHKNNILGFNKFLFTDNVLVFKKFIKLNNALFYYSIIINYNGQVDFILDNHDRVHLSKESLIEVFMDYNKLIKKYKTYFLNLPLIDLDVLKNNNTTTKIEYINCNIIYKMNEFINKSKRSQFLKKNITTFFKNMYPYTRILDEKYLYISDKESIYLRYKRVNNYNNIDTISSIISSLSNPRLNLSRNDIINKLMNIFSLTLIQADNEYNKWISIKKQNIFDNKKIHTLIADEPGVELNIFNNNNVDMLFELNDIDSFSELYRISKFIHSFTRLYKKFLVNGDKSNEIYFNKVQKINTKDIFTIDKKGDDFGDDIILGLDDIMGNTYKTFDTIDDSKVDIILSNDISDIIGIDDLLSYINRSDDSLSTGSSDSNQSGGTSSSNKSSPRGENNISRYYINRLTDSNRDPNLFKFDPLQSGPSGAKYTYTRICDSTAKRQPIVVDNSELENINNSYDIGSGPDSYSNVITAGVDKNLHYICPKYWDISRNISMDPNNPNWTKDEKDKEIIPYTQTSGKTTKTVLDRTSKWWGEGRGVSQFYVDFLEDKRYRGDGVLMPCCFGKKMQKKGELENTYISSVTPAKENTYSQPYDSFKHYFNQTDVNLATEKKLGVSKKIVSIIIKEKMKEYKSVSLEDSILQYDSIAKCARLDLDMLRYLGRPKNTDRVPFGFVKVGINQDHSSFLTAVSTCLNITIDKLLDDITNLLTIEKYQKIGMIVNFFKKDHFKITNNEIESFCIWTNKSSSILVNDIKIKNCKNIDELLPELNNPINGKYISYIFDLYISWNWFKEYIFSSDFKDDKYILPVLEILYNKNIIILEHIFNDIKLKVPLNYFIPIDDTYIIILKRAKWYEPLFYRTFWPDKSIKNNIKKKIDLTQFEKNLDIFNISNPEPNEKALMILQSAIGTIINIINTKLCPLYEILKKLKSNNIIIRYLVIDSYNQVSHLVSDNNELLPIESQPAIDNTNYDILYNLNDLEKYNFDDSISFIKQCNNLLSINTIITGIIVDSKDNIINVIINDNYIPIKPTKNKTNLQIIGNTDLRIIETLIINNNITDDRYIFNDFFNFENNLNQLFNTTIISYLKSKEYIDKHLEVLNINDFTINSLYNLEKLNVTIDSKIYSIYHKAETAGIFGIVYKSVKLKSPDENLYPNWGKIYVKYNYIEEIKNILNNPIRLPYYKKKLIYPIIKSITDKIIHVEKMDPSKYVQNKLCFMDDINCTYPCKSTKSICKLTIHDKSYDGNNLLNKFTQKLIDLLVINKDNIENILNYKIEPYELKKTTKPDELFFTYADFKNDIIDSLLEIDNSYIRNIDIY